MSKKVFAVLLIVVLVFSLMSVGIAQEEEERWVGADELPVSPLACPVPEGEEAPAAEEGEMMEMPVYDGGLAVDAPDLVGQPITLVDVPKLIGIGYFNATSAGMQEAAAELGNVTVTTDGPTEGDIVQQIEFIERYITQGVNGILFAANDPVAISPVLRDAPFAGYPRCRLRRQQRSRRPYLVRESGRVQRHRQGDGR